MSIEPGAAERRSNVAALRDSPADLREDGRVPSAEEIRRRWVAGAVVGMIFLVFPSVDIVRGDSPVFAKVLGLAVIVVIGVSYMFVTPSAMNWTVNRRLALLAGLLIVSGALWPVAGSSLTSAWMFIGITAGATLSFRLTGIIALTLAAGMLLLSRVDHQPAPWELAGALIGLSLWMCAFMSNIRLSNELRATRQELAVAAVAAERERIGRDLHDILGHSLTAIAVKAGLARRLIQQGADGAMAEVADVERLAREALADVRATASGYREVSLASELAVAGMVLRASGIAGSLPSAVDDVDPAFRELFGYVVREAVTNVVRHSGARQCTVTVGPRWVLVCDDGVGAADATESVRSGSGLAGLCERVRQLGGTLDVGPIEGGGFRVRVDVPVPAIVPTDPIVQDNAATREHVEGGRPR